MKEFTGLVTLHGNPMTLAGNEPVIGEAGPDFTVLTNDLAPTGPAAYKGKVVIISAVPSLDTPVCEIETKTFNEEAGKLGDNVVILTISMDLPFAQKRWCAAEGISAVKTLSDHRDASFGAAYGVLIKELRLLARAVFVLDRDGVLRYKQLVSEIGNEPDYEAVLEAVKSIL